MSGLLNNSLFLSTAAAAGGYQIERSLRFNSSDSGFLSRTPSTAGNQQTFSISFWTKLASIGSFTFISSGSANVRIGTSTNNVLAYDITPVSGSRLIRTTTAVLRDPSAWYHILFSVNTTSATQEHRFRVYVNGAEVLFDVLSLGSGYLPQNSTIPFNNTSLHEIGRRVVDNDTYWNGYLADIHFIDGQALTPSSFTEVSATTGRLEPIEYTGGYGTGTTVATATGALPIFNTTDTFGAVKGTGIRTDASASSLVLAVPLDGTNGGTTFTDQIPTGRTSGAKTLTVYGNTNTSTTTSKFYGSSGYFDGTGDYLDAGQSSDFTIGASDDFTFEAYINPLQVSDNTVFGIGSNSIFAYRIISGSPYLYLQGTGGILNTGTISANTWTHVAVTRSGGTLRSFINGVLAGSVSSTAFFNAINGTGAGTFIGAGNLAGTSPPGYNFTGYIQEIRFYKNFAKYTAAFTPVNPTNSFYLQFADNSSNTAATLGKDTSGNSNNWTPNNFSVLTGTPVTVAAATGALPILNTTDTYGATLGSGVRTDALASSVVLDLPIGTSAGLNLTDQAPTGRTSGIKTITNEGITNSTSITKFYGGAGYFNNASGGDIGITTPNSADFNFGTGDFTIEFWVYPNVLTRRQWFLRTTGQDDNASAGFMFELGVFTSVSLGGITYNFSAFTLNQWTHCAVTRSGTTLRIFKDGILNQTFTSSDNVSSSNALWVGKNLSGYSFGCNMYLQDLRIYKGVAKYTSAFTVSVSPQQQATVGAGNDSLVDTPTSYGTDTSGVGGVVRGNYATWNPLDKGTNTTLANGNLDCTWAAASGGMKGTIGISSGKWYWEVTVGANTSVGLIKSSVGQANSWPGDSVYGSGGSYAYAPDGQKVTNSSYSAYGTAHVNGNVVGVAYDATNGKLFFSQNGTWQASGDPAAGTNAAFTSITGEFSPGLGYWTSPTTNVNSANFGQRAFSYTAPSGFKALCDTNLGAPLVALPSTVMDVALWTGNGSAQTVSGLNFDSDFLWIKRRDGTNSHQLTDSVRGLTKYLFSDATLAEENRADQVTATSSTGFSLGSNAAVNASAGSYVGWGWDAGTSTVSNTAGSITSQVRANVSAGFSVSTWTGTATAGTVGHGLGVAPEFIIVKNRTVADAWYCYHKSLGNAARIQLNETSAPTTGSSQWNSTSPTSTVYSVGSGSWHASGNLIVSYNFAPVVGYSNGFSYTGNGSTDGVFQYLGFRPRLILLKCSSTTGNWTLVDTSREGYNVDNDPLYPNLSNAEGTTDLLDITSNGFKLRTTDASVNSSGATYIGFAWAEAPFAYSRAR